MRIMRSALGIFFAGVILLPTLLADSVYQSELDQQVTALLHRYPDSKWDEIYFRDMAIITHKADAAEMYDTTADWLRNRLFKPLEEYVKTEWDAINERYENEPYAVTLQLKNLAEYEKWFQPTAGFLESALGKAIQSEMIQERSNKLEALNRGCSSENSLALIQFIRKAGLFATNDSTENSEMRRLMEGLQCCLGWRPEIHYRNRQAFETDYDAGIMMEEAVLKLESSGSDWNDAFWTGEWTYGFQGREGMARAVSKANLRYRKGQDFADLVISSGKVDSTSGRMNMPIPVAGDHRTLEISEPGPQPVAQFKVNKPVPLFGCQDRSED